MCIFCDIVEGKIPSKKVYEDDTMLAFYDIEPQAPVHVVIVPKKHYNNICEIDNSIDMNHFMKKIGDIAKELKIDKDGFRIVINTGKFGGQTVEHLHFHLLGGRELQWPPG